MYLDSQLRKLNEPLNLPVNGYVSIYKSCPVQLNYYYIRIFLLIYSITIIFNISVICVLLIRYSVINHTIEYQLILTFKYFVHNLRATLVTRKGISERVRPYWNLILGIKSLNKFTTRDLHCLIVILTVLKKIRTLLLIITFFKVSFLAVHDLNTIMNSIQFHQGFLIVPIKIWIHLF